MNTKTKLNLNNITIAKIINYNNYKSSKYFLMERNN